ncbi:MAG: adenylate/guanylate cyclase domain-containing protein [Chloroflexaceae bacterium]|nr:adenylate/guanylate cyclase domain-containing protein [Chloroflexaceae bacterium]
MTIQAPALLETFASYVPGLIIHYLTADPRPLTGPVAERFPAAVLLADISGFTALTEELTRSGPAGVEEVSSLLNRYFGILIDLIDDHGGDIVEFTGDGVIALWPTVISGETLAEATVRAVQCGLLVQQQIAAFTTVDNLHLTLRISIGAGEVLFATVGGALGRWELVVAGEPLTQASAAEHYTTPRRRGAIARSAGTGPCIPRLYQPERWLCPCYCRTCSAAAARSGSARHHPDNVTRHSGLYSRGRTGTTDGRPSRMARGTALCHCDLSLH